MAFNVNDKKGENVAKPLCKYGLSCYQKNPEHQRKYRHPSPQPTKESLDVNTEEVPKLSPQMKKKKITDYLSPNPSAKGLNSLSEKDAGKVSPSRKKAASPISPSPSEETISRKERSPRRRRTDGQLPPSPLDKKENIKEKFLIDMPQDFFDLWDFCCEISSEDPSEAFAELELHLVGPYDVMSKKIRNKDILSDNILCHWRYYYDPPEFQTVIRRDGDDWYHIGYFRDDPSEMPFGLASNCAAVGPKLKLMGDNIFAALNSEVLTALKRSTKNIKEKFTGLQEKLEKFAKKKKYSLDRLTPKTKARDKKVVAKTFHGLGIVVPYDRKTEVGYRTLPETDANLKAILRKISDCQTEEARLNQRSDLDEILTNLQFANDECDYGMGLELGIDLFCFGDPYLHKDLLFILPLAYDLLQRPEYGKIIRAHLKNRTKGDKLSIKEEEEERS